MIGSHTSVADPFIGKLLRTRKLERMEISTSSGGSERQCESVEAEMHGDGLIYRLVKSLHLVPPLSMNARTDARSLL